MKKHHTQRLLKSSTSRKTSPRSSRRSSTRSITRLGTALLAGTLDRMSRMRRSTSSTSISDRWVESFVHSFNENKQTILSRIRSFNEVITSIHKRINWVMKKKEWMNERKKERKNERKKHTDKEVTKKNKSDKKNESKRL